MKNYVEFSDFSFDIFISSILTNCLARSDNFHIMPVTFHPASHGSNVVKASPAVHDPCNLLRKSRCIQDNACKDILQSPFDASSYSGEEGDMEASKNGFVFASTHAYNNHHHPRTRPEDICFALLSQFSFYIYCHSDKLRDKFVDFEDKKTLTVSMGEESRYSLDFGLFAKKISDFIDQNVNDLELKDWIMPAFSITTEDDNIVAPNFIHGHHETLFRFPLSTGLRSP